MPKLNKGKTTKLSIKLSGRAKNKIIVAAGDIGVSKAGVILLELTKILKNPPSKKMMEDYKKSIVLEKDHFNLSVNEKVTSRINDLVDEYGMKKNVLIGYILSAHFDPKYMNIESKTFMVQINSILNKKLVDFSEKHYIPLNALVADCILKGPYEELPFYDGGETKKFFTTIPAHIRDQVNEKAYERNIPSHLYTSLCLYKQFMTPEGLYYE